MGLGKQNALFCGCFPDISLEKGNCGAERGNGKPLVCGMGAEQQTGVHPERREPVDVFTNGLIGAGVGSGDHKHRRNDIVAAFLLTELFNDPIGLCIRGRDGGRLFFLQAVDFNLLISHTRSDMTDHIFG